jgi:hypothetical protein
LPLGFTMPVCLSLCMQQLKLLDFDLVLVITFQFHLKLDNREGHLMWRPTFISVYLFIYICQNMFWTRFLYENETSSVLNIVFLWRLWFSWHLNRKDLICQNCYDVWTFPDLYVISFEAGTRGVNVVCACACVRACTHAFAVLLTRVYSFANVMPVKKSESLIICHCLHMKCSLLVTVSFKWQHKGESAMIRSL